ncbi:MAG: hypothetical protein ABSD59_06040 [Terracidiphilus sp.]|jgi:hypothetical protein
MTMSSFLRSLPPLALLVFVPTLTGCFNTMAPVQPKILAPAITSYPASVYSSDVNDYRAAIKAKDYTQARVLRDQIVYRTLADIESTYGRFEVQLTTSRATENVLADTAQLGITAATTVVGASDVKDILAASLSGLQGTQLSIDKNFFREKTTESLISQMRADRKNLEAQIISRLAGQDVIPTTDPTTKANIAAYSLDAAWIDVTQYYYAGTVPSALVSIATSTGDNATKAATKLTKTVRSLTPTTAAQAQQSVNIRTAYQKLSKAASSTDPTVSGPAIASLRALLTACGTTPDASDTAAQLLTQLQQVMDAAVTDDATLETLSDAITTLKLN